ncbi:Putative glycosyltransferase [Bacillus subtilis]|nr:Putative glycosyltransferase [Bacillus subtilis]
MADKADVLSFLSKVKMAIGARDELAFIKAFEQGSSVTPDDIQSIKLALHAARASHEVAEPVKQEADQLFHKLNGQLFMQQDHPSYSQIVMSFPLFSKSGAQDMTVLFKGKKEADGKLDPSHCRLLFLLQLDTLKETVVDCLIQQKVMTITIETDFELQAAIDPMVPALKQGLKEMGYSLSGVNAKKRIHPEEKTAIDQYITSISDQEVDVKI